MLASGCPGVLPVGFVEKLIQAGDLIQDFTEVVKLVKGQKILFTAGPLCGINGTVHWANKERVSLLVNLLGRETLVTTTANLIAPVE